MGDTLIDLGELPRGGAERVPAAPIPRAYRPVLALLALALVALLAGSGHRSPPAPPLVIAARLADSTFVAGDRLFVVSPGRNPNGAAQNEVVTGYALPAGTLLSRTTVSVTGAIFDVAQVGGTILVSYQVDSVGTENTVALAAGTDRALWRRPARMAGVSVAAGLVLLRENSPEFGPLHWYGVDLASGRVRWTLEQPAQGYISEVEFRDSFPGALVTVSLDGVMTVRDTTTAAVTARTTIPVPPDWARRGIALWPDGDLVLVGDHTGATAYALPGLTPRWRAPVDLYSSFVGSGCGTAVCLFSPRGRQVVVLDRATGRRLWSADRWAYGERIGPYLLAFGGEGSAQEQRLDVVDLATGRVLGGFGPWQIAGEPLPDGTVLGMREEPAADTYWIARLDPRTRATLILGTARQVSGDCGTTAGVLVCRRLDASVGIWRLTGPR